MLEAASSVSSVGFSPLNFIELWSAASATRSATRAGSGQAAQEAATAGTAVNSQASEPASAQASAAAATADLQVQLEIARLKAAAAQVARNRAAQLVAGGGYVAGGSSFSYAIGPDGQLYATGVVLSYDTAPIAGEPQATIEKMQRVRAAALASSSPSAADFAAAARATQEEMQARVEMVQAMAAQYLDEDNTDTARAGNILDVFA